MHRALRRTGIGAANAPRGRASAEGGDVSGKLQVEWKRPGWGRSAPGQGHRTIVVLVAAALLGANAANAAEEAPNAVDAEARTTMHQVFDALATLLPLGMDDQRFADPANQAEIEQALDVLAGAAGDLHQHGRKHRDAGFRHLSRGLASDVEEIRYRYQSGRIDEARYFLIESTKNCVACHSRLPRARDFALAEALDERIDTENLSVHERAQILVATRRFDAALDAWEAHFRDPSVRPVDLDIGGQLLDYLSVTLRVVQEPTRARKTLEGLAGRNDVPRYLRRHLARWIADLKAYEKEGEKPPSLDRARQLLDVPADVATLPFGRDRLVADLLASSVLLQLISTSPRDGDDAALAEAYYLLGVAEVRNIDAFWVPQAEFHLETAIRLDPQGKSAVNAYALLEETVLVGYGGSSGHHLPPDVWSNLEELRRLVDGEVPAAP